MPFINRRSAALLLASLIAVPSLAVAADWPERTIEIIVPYSAGGTTDTTSRMLGEIISRQTGQSVVIQNFPGAGATLGSTKASRASNDGYTLFMGQISSHGIAPAIYTNLQYDPVDSFVPIGRVLSVPNILVVPASSPANTYDELIELAKTRRMTFASSGVGSSVHLSGELFKAMTGLDMVHVPYKGSGEAIPALLGGQVDMMFDNAPSAMAHIQSGAVKALGVTTSTRTARLPDVATIAELGGATMADFEVQAWWALFAPAGADPEVISQINAVLNNALADPEFIDFAEGRAATTNPGTPDDLASHVASELAKWEAVVDAAGIPKK